MAALVDAIHRGRLISSRDSSSNVLLEFLSDPFQPSLQTDAVWASLSASAALTVIPLILFLLFRPRHTLIYAPKLKWMNEEKERPPHIGDGIFAWVKPVLATNEQEIVKHAGMDAALFLRFAGMCRNIFLVMSVVGCAVMIPVNMTQQSSRALKKPLPLFVNMTPLNVSTGAVWSQVVCAWVFDLVVFYFLWRNYKAVRRLRQKYFQDPVYQNSLHAKTLMVTDLPPEARSNAGLLLLIEEVNPTTRVPLASIGRNMKTLPSLVREHENTVRKLEAVVSRYLKKKHTDRALHRRRPTMRAPRDSRANNPDGKVDAIDYLSMRIQVLEEEIHHLRASVDRRDIMPCGFVSWESTASAHAVAFAARKKHIQGTTICLAPQPQDLIWENLALSKQFRSWKRAMNLVWVVTLTVVWIVPNVMIAVFLSNLDNLGVIWPAFRASLREHAHFWALVQGVASPALTSLIYLILPIIFRRLSVRAGALTKTSRELNVLRHMYSFYIFNNLIVFSLFSAVWTLIIAAIFVARSGNKDYWQVIAESGIAEKIVAALCNFSPFWVTWLLQRNIGAALDLVQGVNLAWLWGLKTFRAPTPRQYLEWTAPRSFDYAASYTYFLYYATIALCFATIQPIILPVTGFLFALDAFVKKYLLLYVFVTKTESGGHGWSVLCNRMLFATFLANCTVILVVVFKGTSTMVWCLLPLPFLILVFKFYTARIFGVDIDFYARRDRTDEEGERLSKDQLNMSFGHPAFYTPLITPMLHPNAGDVLQKDYTSSLVDNASAIALEHIPSIHQQKGFSIVANTNLDIPYYENHPEFGYSPVHPHLNDKMERTTHSPRPRTIIDDILPTSFLASLSSATHFLLPSVFDRRKPETVRIEVDIEEGRSEIPIQRSDGNTTPPAMDHDLLCIRAESNESEARLLSHAASLAGSDEIPAD